MARNLLWPVLAAAVFLPSLPSRALTPAVSQQPAARAIPPALTRRFTTLHASLSPSARSWVDQQAHLEAQKPGPDVAGLEESIRTRFPALKGKKGGKPLKLPTGGSDDIAALVFIVLMEASNEADSDLKAIMDSIKTMTAAKEELRALMAELKQFQQSAVYSEGDTPCTSPLCRALPQRLHQLAVDTSALPHPVHIQASSTITYTQLNSLEGQLRNHLNSLTETSQAANAKRRTLTARRAKLLAAASKLANSIPPNAGAAVANLK